MRIKTIVLIIVVILLTVIIMQNTDDEYFKVLFTTVHTSKMVMMAITAVIGFIAGILVARPRRSKFKPGEVHGTIEDKYNPNTLSDEDKDYIS